LADNYKDESVLRWCDVNACVCLQHITICHNVYRSGGYRAFSISVFILIKRYERASGFAHNVINMASNVAVISTTGRVMLFSADFTEVSNSVP
jgi:hypothetical protein